MEPDNPIYIVVEDIDWEGSEINGAFFNLQAAQDYARKMLVVEVGGKKYYNKMRIEKWMDTERLERSVAF